MSGRIPEHARKMEREGERERWLWMVCAAVGITCPDHPPISMQLHCALWRELGFGRPKEGSVSFLVAQQCLCKCSGGSCILSWGKRQERRGVKCVGRLVDFGGGLLAACSVSAYDCPFSRHL